MGRRPRWKGVQLGSWGIVGLAVFFSLLPHRLFIPNPQEQAAVLASDGREIATAMEAMAESNAALYPNDFSPTATSADYVAALFKDGFLNRGDLRIFAGPHHPTAADVKDLSDRNIAFTMFRVGADDPPGTVFLISKADVFKELVVIVRKDGRAGVYTPAEALAPILDHLPRGNPQAFP